MILSRSHLGSFTPISGTVGFRFDSVHPSYSRQVTDETPGYQRFPSYVRLPSNLEFSCRGTVFDNTLGYMSLASQSSITIAPLTIRVFRWQYRKVWYMTDESAPGDADVRSWRFGIPTSYISFTGVAQGATGPVLATADIQPLSFTNDLFGTFSADYIVTRASIGNEMTMPGWVRVDVSGVFTDTPTYTPFEDPATASHDFSWLFPDVSTASDDPLEGTASLDVEPGETISDNMAMYDVSIITNALLNQQAPHASTQVECRLIRTTAS